MNLARATINKGIIGLAVPPASDSGIVGGRLQLGDLGSQDFPTADVIYSGRLSGITDTVNPTLVLSTGVVTLNGATLAGMTSGRDVFEEVIPGISTGMALYIVRTDANGGVLSINGGTTGFAARISAGKHVQTDEASVIQSDTLTFDNSTTAAATVLFVVLGKDV